MSQTQDHRDSKKNSSPLSFKLPITSLALGSMGTALMIYPHLEDYFIKDINDNPKLYEEAAKEFCVKELSAKAGFEKAGDSLRVSFSEKAFTTCVDSRLDMQKTFEKHSDNFFAGAADVGGLMVAASLIWAAFKYRGHKKNQRRVDNRTSPKPS